jgi:thioredoxin 1
MSVTSVNNKNFNSEVIGSERPVLVDFWAPWCGPCRMLSPVVDDLAAEKKEILKVVKVNIDEEPELAQKFGVMSIPTLAVIKDGKVVATSVGAKPKQALEEWIKKVK